MSDAINWLVVSDSDECPDGYERVTLRTTFSRGVGVDERGCWRSVVNYLADGRIDHSRSHYSINGRRVSGAAFRRWTHA